MSLQNRVHTEFSQDLRQTLESNLLESLTSHEGPRIAAFDADGTLWDTDIGENFFEYQIRHCNLKTLPADPWHYYESTKARDPHRAYLWLAQINNGQLFKDVTAWAEAAVTGIGRLPIFNSQMQLIEKLKSLDFEIFVVTASVEWAVIPAAARLGIRRENVLGIKTRIQNGFVTDHQDGLITWREGKADALIRRTNGIAPLFCSGNTSGDVALLNLARACALAIRSKTNLKTPLGETEIDLYKIAQEKKWLSHEF